MSEKKELRSDFLKSQRMEVEEAEARMRAFAEQARQKKQQTANEQRDTPSLKKQQTPLPVPR